MRHASLALLLLAAGVQAHDGHGLGGDAHWHAVDAVGFVGAAVAVAAVWWLGRRK